MKQLVTIKSYPKGVSIYLDQEAPFEEVVSELSARFREAASFFKDARMVVTFENRELSEQEESTLVEAILDNSQVHVTCIVGKNPATEKLFVKALEQMEVHSALSERYAQIYRGNLTQGSISSANSVVLIGDVLPGCSVISEKDIYIFGALNGEAHAGVSGEPDHYVVAQEMNPEQLIINGFSYKEKEKPRWSRDRKNKAGTRIAYVQDGAVVVVPYNSMISNSLGES